MDMHARVGKRLRAQFDHPKVHAFRTKRGGGFGFRIPKEFGAAQRDSCDVNFSGIKRFWGKVILGLYVLANQYPAEDDFVLPNRLPAIERPLGWQADLSKAVKSWIERRNIRGTQ